MAFGSTGCKNSFPGSVINSNKEHELGAADEKKN